MLSKKLKVLRAEKDISQDDLAAYMGVKRNTISNWENEVSKPDSDQLQKLSAFFGTSIDTLLDNQIKEQKSELVAESKSNYIVATERHLKLNYLIAQLPESDLETIEKMVMFLLEGHKK
jgi:transcriptional regulator with XRE-family HTH domain